MDPHDPRNQDSPFDTVSDLQADLEECGEDHRSLERSDLEMLRQTWEKIQAELRRHVGNYQLLNSEALNTCSSLASTVVTVVSAYERRTEPIKTSAPTDPSIASSRRADLGRCPLVANSPLRLQPTVTELVLKLSSLSSLLQVYQAIILRLLELRDCIKSQPSIGCDAARIAAEIENEIRHYLLLAKIIAEEIEEAHSRILSLTRLIEEACQQRDYSIDARGTPPIQLERISEKAATLGQQATVNVRIACRGISQDNVIDQHIAHLKHTRFANINSEYAVAILNNILDDYAEYSPDLSPESGNIGIPL